MSKEYLEFEKPIEDIENKIKNNEELNNLKETENLKYKVKELYKKIYSNLTPWQKVQISRHANRPHSIDYINNLFTDFINLAGDRRFGEDLSIISGIGKFFGKSVMILGTEKGNNMETRLKHNFGMVKPEGYRKAYRLYKLAGKFNLPVITFIDTAGAYPGKEAEERGQAEAIANTISISLKISVPIISIIIGEGGSGGAVALATADKIIMLENSIYSVISPEGCASILWRDPNSVKIAAESLNLTSSDCKRFGIVDEIIPEPPGGAHRNSSEVIKEVGNSIQKQLHYLGNINKNDLLKLRNEKFLNITSSIS